MASTAASSRYADMAELADAQDLESCGQPCRFNSCYPHQKKCPILSRKQLIFGHFSFYFKLTPFFIVGVEITDNTFQTATEQYCAVFISV